MLANHAFNEGLDAFFILCALLGRQNDKGQSRLVWDLAAIFREEDWDDPVTRCKEVLNFGANAITDRRVFNVRPAVGIALVQVLFETKMVRRAFVKMKTCPLSGVQPR